MGKQCRHSLGDMIKERGFFLCLHCWARLDEWPVAYGTPEVFIGAEGGSAPPQTIIWRATKAVAPDGLSLNDFLSCMARRYRQRTRPRMELTDAYDHAIEYLREFPDPFGHPDYDWSCEGARDLADEDMDYWDAAEDLDGNGGP